MAESNASVAELEAEFAAAHQDGMKALDDRDYEGLGVAIQREQAVIDKMGRLLGLAPTSGDVVRAGPIHTQTDREFIESAREQLRQSHAALRRLRTARRTTGWLPR